MWMRPLWHHCSPRRATTASVISMRSPLPKRRRLIFPSSWRCATSAKTCISRLARQNARGSSVFISSVLSTTWSRAVASCCSHRRFPMVALPNNNAILAKAVAGERLSPAEGLQLLQSSDLAALGRAADEITRRLHPENYRTYNIDRNINYTNVCTAVCDFCAFYRPPKSSEGYVLEREELYLMIQEYVDRGGEQIMLQVDRY